MPTVTDLARRLRHLRESAGLTQLELSRKLGVSVPLISSWEKATAPPEARIDQYARLFALGTAAPDEADPAILAAGPRRAYEQLKSELALLRRGRTAETASQHPLRFPPGQPITIVCGRRPDAESRNPRQAGDPDAAGAHRFADLDALIELLPVAGALNPAAAITVGTPEELSRGDLTDHVIVLGHIDHNRVAADLTERLDLPVRQLTRDCDCDDGGFLVATGGRRREITPDLERTRRRTVLKSDVALFLRAPNPLNPRRTLTVFSGTFGRGTLGVVRALTDRTLGTHNAARAVRQLTAIDTYTVVCRVRIFADEVVVPDWTVDDDRLHEWPEAVSEL